MHNGHVHSKINRHPQTTSDRYFSSPRAARIRATPLRLLVAFPCFPVGHHGLFARILRRTSDIRRCSASHVTHRCLSARANVPQSSKVPFPQLWFLGSRGT